MTLTQTSVESVIQQPVTASYGLQVMLTQNGSGLYTLLKNPGSELTRLGLMAWTNRGLAEPESDTNININPNFSLTLFLVILNPGHTDPELGQAPEPMNI